MSKFGFSQVSDHQRSLLWQVPVLLVKCLLFLQKLHFQWCSVSVSVNLFIFCLPRWLQLLQIFTGLILFFLLHFFVSFSLLFLLFSIACETTLLIDDWFVFMFFFPHHHAGLWLAAVCYVASCAAHLSSGVPPAVGGSLWSLGLGSAPSGPPAPGRLHRSISWAGTVHHMCDPTPPQPLQTPPGIV